MPRRLIALVLLAAASSSASAEDGGGTCRAQQTDRIERPASDVVLPRLGRAFGVAPDTLRGASYVRCDRGRLMGCMVGANLNCGRADTSRRLTGADAFCRDNPGSDFVPLAATGHDTIYEWRCVGMRAVAGRTVDPVDRLGFIAGNWKPLR